ncbi:cytochrome P450 3A29-like, partial [Strongylocentrotus purpuratus]|uniref:Cytochrome P450 n=1 Tax=Strongylocentrotus purpuratus TaxID=7668 RepID=A0A7M7P643_STRPU
MILEHEAEVMTKPRFGTPISMRSMSAQTSVWFRVSWYDRWCHQYFQRCGIPVADYIPFFGNILQWRHGLQHTFTEYVKKHGRVVGMYDFRRPVLIINDPDILKNVLVKNFSSFYNRRMSETINECCDTLVASFSKAQEGGKAADCRVLFGGFTMDAIAKCGFGLKVDSQQNKDDPFVKNAKKAFDFSFFNPAFMIV